MKTFKNSFDENYVYENSCKLSHSNNNNCIYSLIPEIYSDIGDTFMPPFNIINSL